MLSGESSEEESGVGKEESGVGKEEVGVGKEEERNCELLTWPRLTLLPEMLFWLCMDGWLR